LKKKCPALNIYFFGDRFLPKKALFIQVNNYADNDKANAKSSEMHNFPQNTNQETHNHEFLPPIVLKIKRCSFGNIANFNSSQNISSQRNITNTIHTHQKINDCCKIILAGRNEHWIILPNTS
jgi:hypothetical protein